MLDLMLLMLMLPMARVIKVKFHLKGDDKMTVGDMLDTFDQIQFIIIHRISDSASMSCRRDDIEEEERKYELNNARLSEYLGRLTLETDVI